jgi:hypothetical protein
VNLIDYALLGKYPPDNKLSGALRYDPAVLRRAHRFIFDSSASAFMGELVRHIGLLILGEHEWARAPFPETWIEYDHRAFWKAIGGTSEGGDKYQGMLISPSSLGTTVIRSLGDEGVVALGPFMIVLHSPVSAEEELEMAQKFGQSRLSYRRYLVGGTEDSPLATAVMSEVCRSHKVIITPHVEEAFLKYPQGYDLKKRREIFENHQMMLMMTLLPLLLLTRPHGSIILQDIGHERKIIKGKRVILQAHTKVTMRVEHENPVKRYASYLATGLHRPRHEVRGHWCQNRKLRPHRLCEGHQWEPLDKDHFYCLKCGAKRWWKIPHERGREELGRKTTEYKVKR